MAARSQNRIGVTIGWLVFWAVAAGGGWFALDRHFSAKRDEIREGLKALESVNDQGRTLAEQEQNLRRDARDGADRRKLEMESSFGLGAASAFKNPDFSLREALQRAAVACAPTNASAEVSVERFTEFSVTFSRTTAFTTNEMVEVARTLVPLAKEYLDSMRFSVKGSVVAELDRGDIEFVDDWARVPMDRIVSLLAREVEPALQDTALERWKQERALAEALAAQPEAVEKLPVAEKKLREAAIEAYENLNGAINLLHQATSLSGVTKARDLDERIRQLKDATDRMNRAREFFSDPGKAWRASLAAEGISGDTLEALTKGLPVVMRTHSDKAAKALEALDGAIKSGRHFLQMAGDQFGNWEFSPESGQFGFTSQELAGRFQRAREQLIRDDQELEKTLRVWNEAVAP